MMPTSAIRRLVDFVGETSLEEIPRPTIENARLSLLDTIGCIIGGMEADEVSRLLKASALPDGPVPIVGTHWKSKELFVAFIEAIAGTWYDLDSGHRHPSEDPPVPGIQPPSHIVPALLACAPSLRVSGSELLRSYILAYEFTARLAIASRLREGLHGHGAHPTVGAAVAAALLHGARGDMLERQARCAMSMCIMGNMAPALEGASVRNAYAGLGTMNGLIASRVARLGFTAAHDPWAATLVGPLSDRLDESVAADGLGRVWETTRGYLKTHACCRWNHPALDALEDLVSAHGQIDPSEVEQVVIDTFLFASRLTDEAPTTELGAKFSLPYATAACFVLRSTGFDAFRPAQLARPEIREFARRVIVRENPEYSAALPRRRPTSVTVHLRTGRDLTSRVDGSRGDPGSPFPREMIEDKFLSLVSLRLGAARAQRALETINGLEEMVDAKELVEALSGERTDGRIVI